MTPEAAAIASAAAIRDIGSHFMFDPATYARGAELGHPGMSFYFAGRGGALGAVPADVVTAAFAFFAPATVEASWDRSADVEAAAVEFAACSHRWADLLPTTIDYPRLAELAGALIGAGPAAGRPLFAAWRALAEPTDDPRALAVHRLNVLRELRGSTHALAVLGAGVPPAVAVAIDSAHMVGLFGWPEVDPATLDAHREALAQSAHTTDHLMAEPFAALGEDERAEFVRLADEVQAAVVAARAG